MDHHALHELIAHVKAGRLGRRAFVQTMVGLGLTAPMAARMLASAGVAAAQPKGAPFVPTKRGGGGPLKTLWWQAPTLLNPHFATGTKDQDASRIFYEPLAAFGSRRQRGAGPGRGGPDRPNGGVAADLASVTWRLKKGVTWHDGKPFTADDVIFNYEFVSDTATAAVTSGSYQEIDKVEKVDSHTVKVTFRPQPCWSTPSAGPEG